MNAVYNEIEPHVGLRYGSVCSGMEAATCAWHPLGWRPQFFSEVDSMASRFLAAKYPETPNLGDMTKFKEWPDATINVLVGGTPCQSFSVAGLRKGMADPRGNLALTYLAIADRYRPEWLVWENVPGVLSSNGGRDFASILGGMAELGYGFAYRVLDAQYVRVESHHGAVPQRRRRVFVVGYLGDWRRAAAVLFERESLSGNPPPRREAGKGLARGIEIGPSGGGFTDVNPTLDSRAKDGPIRNQLAGAVMCADMLAFGEYGPGETASTMKSRDYKDATDLVAHSLRGEGFDASEDGTGRGTPIIPEVAGTMKAMKESGGFSNSADHAAAGYMVPVAYRTAGDGSVYEEGDRVAPLTTGTDANANVLTLAIRGRGDSHDLEYRGDGTSNAILTPNGGRAGIGVGAIATQYAVRRLTPLECTRLQGYPDDYFDSARLNKPLSDSAKYKLLGNSMAVNCMSWIGQRIAALTIERPTA